MDHCEQILKNLKETERLISEIDQALTGWMGSASEWEDLAQELDELNLQKADLQLEIAVRSEFLAT